MIFNYRKLESQLPSFFLPILRDLLSQGYTLTLVGGVVRDFLLTEKLKTDWDIELGHSTFAYSTDIWKILQKNLSQYGRVFLLPYEVIRLEVGHYQLEFSPPRIEHFEEHLSKQGHKNFSATFDFTLSFEESVKRRDFTINSMGLRFKSPKEIDFLDPLGGLLHLRDKYLYPAGVDFSKDPVRFLRAIRFSRMLGFGISQTLREVLNSMNVEGLSPSYLWGEMQKSGDPLGFYQDLLKWSVNHPEIKLPVHEDFLPRIDELKKVLRDEYSHEAWIIALEWVGISAENWQKYFSLSSENARRLVRWASECKAFQKIMPEFFHGEFQVVITLPEFEMLFDWYFTTKQLLHKNPKLPILNMIEEYLPHWNHLYHFEPLKDVKHIDPPFRAKYQVWNLCQRL